MLQLHETPCKNIRRFPLYIFYTFTCPRAEDFAKTELSSRIYLTTSRKKENKRQIIPLYAPATVKSPVQQALPSLPRQVGSTTKVLWQDLTLKDRLLNHLDAVLGRYSTVVEDRTRREADLDEGQ